MGYYIFYIDLVKKLIIRFLFPLVVKKKIFIFIFLNILVNRNDIKPFDKKKKKTLPL